MAVPVAVVVDRTTSTEILRHLEKYRVPELTPEPNMPLGKQIIRNKELPGELSEAVSTVLKEHGVVISDDVTYIFSPVVYKKPTFVTRCS